MSRKTVIMFGMVIGSFVGGYLPTLVGISGLSFTSLLCSAAGGVAGIWLAFVVTK